MLIGVDQLPLFSWAQHMVAPNITGFLLEGEGGEWILGHSGYVGHRNIFSNSLSLLYATPHPQIEVT